MATTKKTAPKTVKANAPAPVTREELTQITKALTTLAKEVKSLKSQLAEAKATPAGSADDLKRRLEYWSTKFGCDSQKLLSVLKSRKI